MSKDTPITDNFRNPLVLGDADDDVSLFSYNLLLESHEELERKLNAITEASSVSNHLEWCPALWQYPAACACKQ